MNEMLSNREAEVLQANEPAPVADLSKILRLVKRLQRLPPVAINPEFVGGSAGDQAFQTAVAGVMLTGTDESICTDHGAVSLSVSRYLGSPAEHDTDTGASVVCCDEYYLRYRCNGGTAEIIGYYDGSRYGLWDGGQLSDIFDEPEQPLREECALNADDERQLSGLEAMFANRVLVRQQADDLQRYLGMALRQALNQKAA